MDILINISSNIYFYFDDYGIYCDLKILHATNDLEIQYRDLKDFLSTEQEFKPGIHVVCLREVQAASVQWIGRIANENPQVRIILIASHIASRLVATAFNSGIADVIVDSVDVDRLLDSLNIVDLELFAATAKAKRIARACAKLELLSPREQHVLNGILAGKQNKQIAADLALSVRTVEMFRSTLMQKLEIRSVADVVKLSLIASDVTG
jgi:two-component system response regulator FixJ